MKGDSWAEVDRLNKIARGGRTDHEVHKYGLAVPEAAKKSAAMAKRLFKAELKNKAPGPHDIMPGAVQYKKGMSEREFKRAIGEDELTRETSRKKKRSTKR